MGLLIRSFTVSWGCDQLFERHPEIIHKLNSDAPNLLRTLLDGLVWRSRLILNGQRRATWQKTQANICKHVRLGFGWIWHNLWTWAVKGTWKVKKSSMELTVPTYHGVLLSNPSFCVFNAPGLFYRQRPAHLEVNYYVKHLVQDTDGGFNQGLEWIVEGQLLKTEGKEGSLRDSWKVSVSLAMVQVADYRLEDGGVSQVSGRSFGTSALQTSMYEVKMSMNSYTNHNVNTYPWYSNLNLTLTWQMTWNPSNRWSLNVPQEWFRVQGSHVLNCRWGDLCTYISPFLWTYAIVGQRLPHVSSSQFCFALACFFPRTRGAKIWLLSVHQVRNIRNARFWGGHEAFAVRRSSKNHGTC